ncbi:MAG: hypothetical protein ABF572_11225 [Gluconobacter sp.]
MVEIRCSEVEMNAIALCGNLFDLLKLDERKVGRWSQLDDLAIIIANR